MSRSGYSEDYDDDIALYRGTVASATRGRRGQRLFRDLVKALDEMPVKRLITNALEYNGEVCALGAVGRARGVSMAGLDPENSEAVAGTFDIADCLAREVVYMNDEAYYGSRGPDGKWQPETPEQRWERMRKWAASQIRPT